MSRKVSPADYHLWKFGRSVMEKARDKANSTHFDRSVRMKVVLSVGGPAVLFYTGLKVGPDAYRLEMHRVDPASVRRPYRRNKGLEDSVAERIVAKYRRLMKAIKKTGRSF